MRPTVSALIVPAPEIQALLRPFRSRHILTSAANVPPHVTLHVPFKQLDQIDEPLLQELAALFAQRPCFTYTLRTLKCFPESGVLYLEPEPAAPFLELIDLIQRRYPDAPPDYHEPVLHLTLAQGDPVALDRLEREFRQIYGDYLPFECTARAGALYVKREGVWGQQTSFPLAKARQIDLESNVH